MAPSSSDVLTPLLTTRRGHLYPSPFFDIANTRVPPNYKALFKYCAFYATTNPLVSAAIQRLARYPVTDIIIQHKDDKWKKKWEQLLVKQLKVREFLVNGHFDYFTYGNFFSTAIFPFIRVLICKKCKAEIPIQKVREFRWGAKELVGRCEACNQGTTFQVKDEDIKEPSRIRLVRFAPGQIDLDYIEVTGDKDYSFHMTAGLKKRINGAERRALERTPWIFVAAARKNWNVSLDRHRIYHMSRPSISDENVGWGLPLIVPILKLLYLTQIFVKAREVIAHEHIIPLRVLYPLPNANTDPAVDLNLATWKSKMEDEIARHRVDPAHLPIMPIPVGVAFIGGDANALSVANEIATLQRDVIAGLMVPLEFIYGGLSFSGSSVSLRMLENDFVNLREDDEDYLNGFLIPLLAEYLDWPPCTVKYADLRTADDVQRQNLFLQLAESGYISLSRLLETHGFDPKEEIERMATEMEDISKMLEAKAKANARAAGEAQLVALDYQIKAQIRAIMRQLQAESELAAEGVSDQNIEVAKAQLAGSPAYQVPAAQAGGEGGGVAPAGTGAGPGAGEIDARQVLAMMASGMSRLDSKSKGQFMSQLAADSPAVHTGLKDVMAQMAAGQPGTGASKPAAKAKKTRVDTRPQPKKNPPRRSTQSI